MFQQQRVAQEETRAAVLRAKQESDARLDLGEQQHRNTMLEYERESEQRLRELSAQAVNSNDSALISQMSTHEALYKQQQALLSAANTEREESARRLLQCEHRMHELEAKAQASIDAANRAVPFLRTTQFAPVTEHTVNANKPPEYSMADGASTTVLSDSSQATAIPMSVSNPAPTNRPPLIPLSLIHI